ncbi:lantibiotic dehydratase [Chryseobacterium sp. Leaf201]|uniref:lantibiotic dehydratase n=1 Tax=Chryseobacterium sp. Leaf201 TaxID=1735672 RepID=UPI0006FDC08C|nr:lantibiotic dehydratase [Chryseobacterium sp. Leaf201]KQM32211.1 hypothetical protein ASE55_16645 [Chryseobacterium sp. Leaf201]
MSQNSFQDFGKIMVRNPLFSYQILFNDENTTKNLDELIRDYFEDEKFLEAIFWSSKQLYSTILKLKNENLSEKKRDRILLTLKKYLIRASTRPTPYGTFAGTAIQNISENDTQESFSNKKKLRLDVNIIRNIIRSIENNKFLSQHISYSANNTLYSFNNQFRYLEIDKKCKNNPQVSSLEKNEILNFVHSKSKKEKVNFHLIYNRFSEDFEEQEFLEFFHELVDSGFLVSELELSQTDKNELRHINEFLEKYEIKNSPEALQYKSLLKLISDYISNIQNSPSGDFNKSEFESISELFKDMKINMENEQIFHVDVLNENASLPEFSVNNLRNLNEAISILSKITAKGQRESEVESFIKIFSEKYETASVSLLEALDPEIGIGFPASENIGSVSNNEFINFTKKSIKDQSKNKQNFSSWLINKIESLSHGETEIRINKNDLQDIQDQNSSLSNSFNIVGQVLNSDKILLQSAGGVHANTLLSRFAYMNNEIQSLCKSIAYFEKEISDDIIFAEIIWIPDGKEANITRKLTYFNYEIPIYYNSSFPIRNQISLRDILVCIENNEIVLKSKNLKKRIIPRLSSAHNFMASNNSIYRFLCALQDQNPLNLAILPDFLSSKKRFFPRIVFKNIILHPYCWILQESNITTIKNSQIPLQKLKDFFKKWNVNQYVLLCQGDNELFLDTSNDSYLDILLDEIYKNHKIIVLKEWLYDPNSTDSFVNQFILPLKTNQPKAMTKSSLNYVQTGKRNFHPGEKWLYFKIYCDANYSDVILKKLFKQIKKLEKNKLVEKWFFIRYLDPHYHIRLRIQMKSDQFSGEIISQANQNLGYFIKKNIIWKISLDTYNREIERYSVSEIDTAEYIFYKDSLLFSKFLKHEDFNDNIKLRMFSAAKNVDSWLDLFKLDLKAKKDFCETMKNSFAKEQSENFKIETEKKYRENQDLFHSFLKNDTFVQFFRERNRNLAELNLNNQNLQDFIHMSLNRWFIANQRNWEFLIYYFCHKYYNRCLYSSSEKDL